MAPDGPNSAAFLWGRDKWYQSRIAPYGGSYSASRHHSRREWLSERNPS